MTVAAKQTRNEKSKPLKVFEVGEGNFIVESSEGKVCYKVSVNNGSPRLCTCDDFSHNKKTDAEFSCKHILAVVNANGNLLHGTPLEKDRAKLDERFIISLQGRDFVKYSGLLDLAHQKGLVRLVVEPIQYPTKENGSEAICKAVAESVSGEMYVDIGDANPLNTNRMVACHIIRMASTRAKARVLRDLTNIGMTCLEELGEFDDDDTSGSTPQNGGKKSPPKADKPPSPQSPPAQNTTAPVKDKSPEKSPDKSKEKSPNKSPDKVNEKPQDKPQDKPESKSTEQAGVPIFLAQKRALENLAQRRSIRPEELTGILQKQFNVDSLDQLTSAQASSFISYLQKSS